MKVTLGRHIEVNSDLDALENVYRKFGVEVVRFSSPTIDSVFHRDVFSWTPFGLIKCSMANKTRQWEPDYWFSVMKVRPALVISPPATFEGADLIWSSNTQSTIGVGNRTNNLGARLVAEFIMDKGCSVEAIELPLWHDQHLLGVANCVNGYWISVEGMAMPYKSLQIPFEEYQKKGPNVVPIGDKVVVMPSGCPCTERLLGNCQPVPIPRLLVHGGGVACATGVMGW